MVTNEETIIYNSTVIVFNCGRDMTSAYIKPYINVDIPSRTPWEEHVYYTYEIHNVIDGTEHDNEGNEIKGDEIFGTEKIYNRSNTVSKDWIVADKLSDERLDNSYYQIIVKAYCSDVSGRETPESDNLLGTAKANLHVRMSQSKFVLDWLDSYAWDEYFIDNDMDKFYDTPEDLITEYLNKYKNTTGCDSEEENWL